MIVNPAAGRGRTRRLWPQVAAALAAEGLRFELAQTRAPGEAEQLAQSAAGYAAVIAVGGDGTVHEVVNGIMQLPEDRRPALGVVPVGSGNDFAHAIGVPLESDRALACALNGSPSRIDLGLMIDEHGHKEFFDNTLGIGFDAVVTIRSHRLPVVRGFLMYLTAVVQTIILNHDPALMQIATEDRQWEQSNLMLTMCNGPREGGGFLVAPDAKLDDGLFHYTMIKKVSRPMMFRLIPEVMRGTHGKFKPVLLGTCTRMNVKADRPLYIHADGEILTSFGSNLRELSFELLPGALKVVRS